MAKVELKQPVVDEIKGVLEGAVGAVIVDYRGLTVEQDTQLRKKLREAGVTYKVFKNTLIKRAAEGTEFAALEPQLEGPTALAVSKEDATAPARILAEFAKTAPKLELRHPSLKEPTMIRPEPRLSLLSHPGKYFWASCLAASSLLSPTWLAFSIRSQRRTVEQQKHKLLFSHLFRQYRRSSAVWN